MCKIVTNRQTNHEKRGPENLHMEMTKQGEPQALQSLIFEYPPAQNRSFNLSTFVSNVHQMAPKRHSKLRPVGASGAKNW